MRFGAVYFSLWLVFVAYWTYGLFGNKAAAYRFNPKWRALGFIAFVALVIVIRIAGLPEFFLRRVIPYSASAEWAGVALCAAGVAFAIWARRALGRNWSGNPTIKEGHELIVAGPYRLVRHPIYTGILVAVFGTLLGSAKVRDLFILAFAVSVVCLKVRIEEKLMLRQFPAAYPDYKKHTKAIIPFVL